MTAPRFDQLNVARRNIIQRNIKKLQESGASDEDIYSYLTEGEGLAPPPEPAKPRGVVEDVARSIMGGGSAAVGTIPAMLDIVMSKGLDILPGVEAKPSPEIQARPGRAFEFFTGGGPQTKAGAAAGIGAAVLTAPLTGLSLPLAAATLDPAYSSGNLLQMLLSDAESDDKSRRNRAAGLVEWLQSTAVGRAVLEAGINIGPHYGFKGLLRLKNKVAARKTQPDIVIESSKAPIVKPAKGTTQATELAKAKAAVAKGEALVAKKQINQTERAIYQSGARNEWLKAKPGRSLSSWKELTPQAKVDLYKTYIKANPSRWQSQEARALGGLDEAAPAQAATPSAKMPAPEPITTKPEAEVVVTPAEPLPTQPPVTIPLQGAKTELELMRESIAKGEAAIARTEKLLEPQPALQTIKRGEPTKEPAVAEPASRAYVSTEDAAGRQFTAEEQHVRTITKDLKDVGRVSSNTAALQEAAFEMSSRVPSGSVLVPIPDHKGSNMANLALARAISQIVPDVEIADVLGRRVGYSFASSMALRQSKRPAMTTQEQAATMVSRGALPTNKPVILIDNIEVSGATAAAARKILGTPDAKLVTYSRGTVPLRERSPTSPESAVVEPSPVLKPTEEVPTRLDPSSPFFKPPKAATIEAAVQPAAVISAESALPSIDPRRLVRLKPAQMAEQERAQFAAWLHDRKTSLPEGENEIYTKKLDEIQAYEESRMQRADFAAWKEKWLSEGFQANVPPGLVGGATGFVYGLAASPPDEDSSARLARVAMWTLAGYGATKGLAWAWARQNKGKVTPQIPRFGDIPDPIVSPKPVIHYMFNEEIVPKGLWQRLESFYTGALRRVYGAEKLVDMTGQITAPAQKNWAKLAEMFGRSVSRTQNWLSFTPDVMLPDGTLHTYEGVLPLEKIYHELGKGNIAELDMLAAARASIKELEHGRPTPMPSVEALRIIAGAPDYLHQAADELRKYHASLFDVLRRYGQVSDAAYAKAMAEEAWYYPLQRVVASGRNLQQRAQTSVAAQPGAFARKHGSKLEIRSPYEVSIEMTARAMRFEEFQYLGRRVKDWANESFPPDVAATIMKRVSAKRLPDFDAAYKEVEALKTSGKLSENEAKAMAAILDDGFAEVNTPGGKVHLMTLWEKGDLATYQIDKQIFDVFKNLTPHEFDGVTFALGLPARAATSAIVHNPFFPYWQFFKDMFSTHFTALYGFRPGVENVRGLWHIYTRSPEYQQLVRIGAPASAQTFRFTSAKLASVAMKDIGENALNIAVREAKELRFADAYRTLIFPLADAGRVGAYLRALDHGQSTIEAAYAAWTATGNLRMTGSSKFSQAWMYQNMFARPAFAAVDQTMAFMGLHPFRKPPTGASSPEAFGKFMIAGMGTIGLFSAGMWLANKDDEEINELRRTEGGSRYWWVRLGDKLHKMPKPPIVGHMFGTVVESALDKMFAKDPQGTADWLSGVFDDAAVNMVPPWAAVPLSLSTNKVIGLGSPIVPDRLANLEPGLMAGPSTTESARAISSVLERATSWAEPDGTFARAVSPAGVQFLARSLGGYTAEDVLRAGDWAMKYSREGHLPPLEELPVISKAFARYPSMNVGPVSEFYRTADKIDKAAKSFSQYSAKITDEVSAKRAASYLERKIGHINLAPAYAATRSEIAELRRAIEDIKAAPESAIPGKDKRLVEEHYLRLIIEKAKIANLIGRQTLEAFR